MISLAFFPVLRGLFSKPAPRNVLFAFSQEIDRNIERYYVVDQRQFISEPFELAAWREAKNSSSLRFSSEIRDYAAGVEDFNDFFSDVKKLEATYFSSIDHKTRDNAEILHQKKEDLLKKFEALRPIIFRAQEVLSEILHSQRFF